MSSTGNSFQPQQGSPLSAGGKAPLPKTPKPASPLLARQSPKVPRKSPVPVRKAVAANGHVENPPAGTNGTQSGDTNL